MNISIYSIDTTTRIFWFVNLALFNHQKKSFTMENPKHRRADTGSGHPKSIRLVFQKKQISTIYIKLYIYIYIPSRELTYPTWGKGKIIFKMPFLGDMLVLWRVYIYIFKYAPNKNLYRPKPKPSVQKLEKPAKPQANRNF